MAAGTRQSATESTSPERQPTSRFEVIDFFRELFFEGGVAIATKLAETDVAPAIRTIIQPDGDVVVFVREDALADAPSLSAALAVHAESIQARLAVIPRAATRVRRIAQIAGIGAGLCGLIFARGNARYVLALAMPLVFVLIGQVDKAIVRLLVRWIVRRARTDLFE